MYIKASTVECRSISSSDSLDRLSINTPSTPPIKMPVEGIEEHSTAAAFSTHDL